MGQFWIPFIIIFINLVFHSKFVHSSWPLCGGVLATTNEVRLDTARWCKMHFDLQCLAAAWPSPTSRRSRREASPCHARPELPSKERPTKQRVLPIFLRKRTHWRQQSCTANPFPVMKTGFSLWIFSRREIPAMKTGSLQWEQGSPVMKTGFSLCGKTIQGKPCFNYRDGFAVYIQSKLNNN